MDRLLRAAALSLLVTFPTGCGDPFVVLGDFPGTFRIVAGVPESAGSLLAEQAIASLLDAPHGLAAGPDEVVYIADQNNARVLALHPAGALEVLIDHSALRSEPRLKGPNGVTPDGIGGLLIADPLGHRVWRLDLGSREFAPLAGTGTPLAGPDGLPALQTPLIAPTGVVVGPDSHVYFSETGGQRVRRIESDGSLLTVAGTGVAGFGGDGGPASQARLREPSGLARSGDLLYIADSGNHRVRALNLQALTLSTVAGTGVAGFGGDDGPALSALLNGPTALAVSEPQARLYIADTGNHRVRAMSLANGRLTTIAGTGKEVFNGDLVPTGGTALSAPSGLVVTPRQFLYVSDTGHQIVRRTAIALVDLP